MGGTVPVMCRLVLKPTVLPFTRAPRSSSGCTVHVTLNSETRQTSHVTKHTQHVVAIQIITCALERRSPWLHHHHLLQNMPTHEIGDNTGVRQRGTYDDVADNAV